MYVLQDLLIEYRKSWFTQLHVEPQKWLGSADCDQSNRKIVLYMTRNINSTTLSLKMYVFAKVRTLLSALREITGYLYSLEKTCTDTQRTVNIIV